MSGRVAAASRPTPAPATVRPATDVDLATWDAVAVQAPGGHVFQSLAWGRWRAAHGRDVRRFAHADGARTSVIVRRWPAIGGGSAYVARGPNTAEPILAVTRLAAVVDRLARDGVDVVTADPEVPATDEAYRAGLAGIGFRPTAELQPSRDRMRVPLGPTVDEPAAFGAVARSTRQRIRSAERELVVVRHDPLAGEPGEGFVAPAEPVEPALARMMALLASAGERLGFPVPPAELEWCRLAYEDGLLVLLEAREVGTAGEPVAALGLYRHGGRLSTAYSADRLDRRRTHPGSLHLLRWRALQLAIRAGASELDLGGVDVAGARGEPRPGDPTYGLYEHKRSFGAEWVTQAGAQERVLRGWHRDLGRAAARLTELGSWRIARRRPAAG